MLYTSHRPLFQVLYLEGWVFSWNPRCPCCFYVIWEQFCVWGDWGQGWERKKREREKKKEDSPYLLLSGPCVSILWLERWAALGVLSCMPNCIVARSCPLSRQNWEAKETRHIGSSSSFYFAPFFTCCYSLVWILNYLSFCIFPRVWCCNQRS